MYNSLLFFVWLPVIRIPFLLLSSIFSQISFKCHSKIHSYKSEIPKSFVYISLNWYWCFSCCSLIIIIFCMDVDMFFIFFILRSIRFSLHEHDINGYIFVVSFFFCFMTFHFCVKAILLNYIHNNSHENMCCGSIFEVTLMVFWRWHCHIILFVNGFLFF